MKYLLLLIVIFLFGLTIVAYSWDIPAPIKVIQKKINILEFKQQVLMRILFFIFFFLNFKLLIAQENNNNVKENFIDLTNQSEVKILDEKKR